LGASRIGLFDPRGNQKNTLWKAQEKKNETFEKTNGRVERRRKLWDQIHRTFLTTCLKEISPRHTLERKRKEWGPGTVKVSGRD